MNPRYAIRFDFDGGEEAPSVMLYDLKTTFGTTVMEIFEEPVCTHASGWSRNVAYWWPGPLAAHTLKLLNDNPLEPTK